LVGLITRSQKQRSKKKLKHTNAGAHLGSVQVKLHEGSPEGTRKTTEKRIFQRDEC